MSATSHKKTLSDQEPQSVAELQDLFEVVSKGKQIWESTFDAIVDPVLIVSKDYRIERANRAAAESCGQEVCNLVGSSWHNLRFIESLL